MAKKNVRNEPKNPQVTENPQKNDVLLILDKMERMLQAVSGITKDGRHSTVPADKEHRNSFLNIDRSSNLFESFLKNFWSQWKDPARFGIFSIIEKELERPEIRLAIDDIINGRKTKAADEFLNKYEKLQKIVKNKVLTIKKQKEMAKNNQTP